MEKVRHVSRSSFLPSLVATFSIVQANVNQCLTLRKMGPIVKTTCRLIECPRLLCSSEIALDSQFQGVYHEWKYVLYYMVFI